MKTIEVIDLLSSPVVSTPKPRERPQLSSDLFAASSNLVEASFSKAIPSAKSEQSEDWFQLDDGNALLPPPKATRADESLKQSHASQSNPWAAPVNDFGSDDFWSFGKDKNAVSNSETHSTSGKDKAKDFNDFFYLSDDFDSSVNLKKSYSLGAEPPAKKRKTSPEPGQRTSLKPTTGNSKGKGLARASSDVGAVSKGGTSSFSTAKSGGLRRTKTTVIDDDPILFTSSADIVRVAKEKRDKPRYGKERDLNDDPILFTSSPDVVRVARERREKARRDRELDSKDDYDDDPFGETATAPSYAPTASVITKRKVPYLDDWSSDIDLPDIVTMASQVSTSTAPKLSRKDSEKILAKYNAEKAATQKEKTAAQNAIEKSRKSREKLEAKEGEKERKRLAREDKVLERQMAADIAKVNQKRTEKKISTPEMIVDLPMDLEKNVAYQIHRLLEPLGVDCEEWHSSVPNVVRWRRKVEAKYNDELGHWEPTPKHVKVEKQVMCIMEAREFVDLVCSEEGHDLDSHVLKMKTIFSGYSVIYLIQGLTIWQRKNKNIKNRQFTEAVRNQMGEEEELAPSSQRPKKKKKKQPEYVDVDTIEDALLSLQVIHGVLVHHTATAAETAEWVVVFTQHISTVPYRQQQMSLDTAFCMESGQVKTGDDAEDTFVKMLQEVNRITAPIAYGIAAEYPSVQKLVAGFEKHGKTMLQNVRKTANKDGALTDREIGTRMSHRVHGIFMGQDERSTDI